MPVSDKSEISQDHKGICGFTHMIQMLIDHGKLSLKEFNQKYKTATAYADEWLTTQVKHDTQVKKEVATALSQSLSFTGDFGQPYDEISLEELLKIQSWDWTTRAGFALTPEAICDYVLRKYSLTMMIQPYHPNKTLDQLWSSKTNNLGTGMYGIKKVQGAGPNKDQFTHYVYIDKSGELMTWGKTGQDAKEALIRKQYTQAVVRLFPQ